MKKIILIICIILLFISSVLFGLKLSKNNSVNNINEDILIPEINIDEILMNTLNSKNKYQNQQQQDVFLKDYELYGKKIEISEYVYVDLDEDNQNELVAKILGANEDFAYLILRYDKELKKVFGHQQDVRGFQCLNKDGTFSGSGGAASTYYFRATFKNDTMELIDLAHSEWTIKDFYINGEIVSEKEMIEFEKNWKSKKQCEWTKYIKQETNAPINDIVYIENFDNRNFDDELINYIIESTKVYADNGYILNSTTGEVTAQKLTSKDIEKNYTFYKDKLEKIINNKDYFGEKFIKDGKECITYKYNKILNYLDIGTHMNIGIGCFDANYYKLYEYGKKDVETHTDLIKYLGIKKEDIIKIILDEIKNDIIEKKLEKNDTILTLNEFNANQTQYSTLIEKEIEFINTEMSLISIIIQEDEIMIKYNYNFILKNLELEKKDIYSVSEFKYGNIKY